MQTIRGCARGGAVLALMGVCGLAAPACAGTWPEYTIQRIGLYGPEQTGSAGLQTSAAELFNAPGFVAGSSNRYLGVNTYNGRDAWAWNGTTTTQIGLAGGVYRGSAGYQQSFPQYQNAAGHVAGYSYRYTGVSTSNGRDVWAWNGTTTTQIGLTGAGYVSSAGTQASILVAQNAAGQVTGYSSRYTGVGTYNGQDSWAWNGTATTQIGLTGGASTGSAGYQVSSPQFQNAAGQVAGYSQRITGVSTNNGQHAWAWNSTTTTQIGLTGGAYTGSAGRQFSTLLSQNEAGQVVGHSTRYTGVDTNNGQDAWVWAGTTTTLIGFTGTDYIGSAGYRRSAPQLQNAAGHVAGYSERVIGENTLNGYDAWAWNGTTTTLIGLTGAGYIGSAGYRHSVPKFQNSAGQVAGRSQRVFGVNTFIGYDGWVWNGTTTTLIGLIGADYIGSTGYRQSDLRLQNTAGQIAGISNRYAMVQTNNGQDAWVWNGTTTTQIGLTGGANTGNAGYQYSEPQFQNDAGQVAGFSHRIVGVSTQIGQDAWYFDPTTLVSTPIIGSVRASDNFAFSQPSILTGGGFLLGYYSFFDGGVNPAIDRAFIFRPDLGFTDLGDLVTGGLTASGWSTLLRPEFADAMSTIVGHGYVNGQTTGQSVFVMTIPAPSAAGLLGICGLVAIRRQRVRG